MKTLFILFVFFLGVADGIELQNYKLVWSAEFNHSTLDLSKFRVVEGVRCGAINSQKAVSIKDGNLVISPFTKDGVHYSGMVSAEGLFEGNYGYWETRVKFHTKPGAWADVWLYSQTVASIEDDINAAGAEIDIFEHRATNGYDTPIEYSLIHGIHFNGYGAKHLNYAGDAYFTFSPDEYHVIGLEWTIDTYIFYLDGKESWRTKKGLTSKPLFPIISVEIQDHFWAGDISHGGFDGSPMIEIDYLRYYKEDKFKFELSVSISLFLTK